MDDINEVNKWMQTAIRNVMDGCQAIANNFAVISKEGMTSITVMVMDSDMSDGVKQYLKDNYRTNDGQPGEV